MQATSIQSSKRPIGIPTPQTTPSVTKVAGIILLNLSDQLEVAREVLRQQRRISTAAQLERLIDVSIRIEGDIALGRGAAAAAAAAAAASGRNVRMVETPGCSSLHREP
ncbi:unnamed protein product [Ectocarpus sp. 8 AP-2014]